MAARNSGSKIVGLAVAGTVGMLGLGTIWAPFYADRDKLRGLHEEADGMSESEKKQYEDFMRHIQANDGSSSGAVSGISNQGVSSNSMWSRMNKAATGTSFGQNQPK